MSYVLPPLAWVSYMNAALIMLELAARHGGVCLVANQPLPKSRNAYGSPQSKTGVSNEPKFHRHKRSPRCSRCRSYRVSDVQRMVFELRDAGEIDIRSLKPRGRRPKRDHVLVRKAAEATPPAGAVRQHSLPLATLVDSDNKSPILIYPGRWLCRWRNV